MANQENSAKKRGRGIVIAAFVVLLAALAVCVVLLLSRKDDSGEEDILDRGFIDENNVDDMMSAMSEKVEKGMFECKMTTDWTFEDAKTESSNAYVANVEANRYPLFFDVYEESTDELLYSSPMLPVGTELTGIRLEKELPAGEYDAVVMYTLVGEGKKEVSTVGFNITISVKH